MRDILESSQRKTYDIISSTCFLLALFCWLFCPSCGKDYNTIEKESIVIAVQDTNIENPVVKKYYREITEHQYPNGDYNSSVILYYLKETPELRLDRPNPILLSWRPNNNTKMELQISRDAKYEDKDFTYQLSKGEEIISLYNLVPSFIYYYKVVKHESGIEIVLATGQFKTEGTVRMLYVDGIFNVRDNGGWNCYIGNKVFSVKYGYLYRGGRLNNEGVSLTSDGLSAMSKERIGTEIDFRLDAEAGNISESPLGKDVVYSRDYQSSVDFYYGNVLKKDDYIRAAKLAIKSIIEWGKPVYYHCAVGADRTGTFAFLIEGLLGVKELDLAKDYELTSLYPELRSRVRTNPDYIKLVKAVASVNGNNVLEQEDFFVYFNRGVPGNKGDYKNPNGSPSERIDEATLKQFISFMTGCSMADLSYLHGF